MPSVWGGDRLKAGPDGSIELESRFDKDWVGRRDRTHTAAEFPGTPVSWDDRWYEVVSARRRSSGTWLYRLEPWREDQPIRNPSHYDEESERTRRKEHAQGARRKKASAIFYFTGVIFGHAPAHAQTEIEREYGISSSALSIVSILPPAMFAAWVATRLPVRNALGIDSPVASTPMIVLGAFLFIESLLRIVLVLSRSKPCGSVVGLIVYEMWRMTSKSGREFDSRAAPRAETRLASHSLQEADASQIERDTYSLREPFLALLSTSEQLRLKKTFGFDPVSWGRRTAIVISIFAVAGASTSLTKIVRAESTTATWSSLLVAALLLIEQFRRLAAIQEGQPAGSVLGGLIRPWCRELLAMEPTSLEEGSIEPAPTVLPDVWEGDEPDEGWSEKPKKDGR